MLVGEFHNWAYDAFAKCISIAVRHGVMAAAALTGGSFEIKSGNRSRAIQNPQQDRLDRGIQHETHLALSRADHPQALAELFCKALGGHPPDRSRQVRGGWQPRDGVHAAPVPPLAAAAPGHAGRGGEATDSAGGEHRPTSAIGSVERGEASGTGRAREGDVQEFCRGERLNPEHRLRTFEVLQRRHRASESLACRFFVEYYSPQRRGGKVIDLPEARRRRCSRQFAADHILWWHSMAHLLEKGG